MTSDAPNLCVLGSINMDLVVRAPRLPAAGETLLGGPFEILPGGKGANQAVAAARAGASVRMIGMSGADAFGERMREVLAENGVAVWEGGATDRSPTGVAFITVGDDSSENTIVVAPGANALLSPEDVASAREFIASADVVLMQLESPLPAVIRAAELAKEAGATVMLNAAPAAKLPWELLGLLDVLIVNQTEAARVAAHASLGAEVTEFLAMTPEKLLEATVRLGVACTVMTLGARGALIASKRSSREVPAFEIQAVDTVGAGDAFCGYFAARYAEHLAGGTLDDVAVADAATWACAAGALAATKQGAIPSIPTRAEVVKLLCRR